MIRRIDYALSEDGYKSFERLVCASGGVQQLIASNSNKFSKEPIARDVNDRSMQVYPRDPRKIYSGNSYELGRMFRAGGMFGSIIFKKATSGTHMEKRLSLPKFEPNSGYVEDEAEKSYELAAQIIRFSNNGFGAADAYAKSFDVWADEITRDESGRLYAQSGFGYIFGCLLDCRAQLVEQDFQEFKEQYDRPNLDQTVDRALEMFLGNER